MSTTTTDGFTFSLTDDDDTPTRRIVLQAAIAGEMAACAGELEARSRAAADLYWMRFDEGPAAVEIGLRIGALAEALWTVLDLERDEVRVRLASEDLRRRLEDVARGACEGLYGLPGDEKHRGIDVALQAEALLGQVAGDVDRTLELAKSSRHN
jgi:hypothetical protein